MVAIDNRGKYMNSINGSCLCGEIAFRCKNTFTNFHLCHCKQCQKITGSAHVSNLFTETDNISWLSGQENIVRYNVPQRSISNTFCKSCGSPIPYISTSGNALIVPAGCLDGEPNIQPQDNIFWAEKAAWYEDGIHACKYSGFPD